MLVEMVMKPESKQFLKKLRKNYGPAVHNKLKHDKIFKIYISDLDMLKTLVIRHHNHKTKPFYKLYITKCLGMGIL